MRKFEEANLSYDAALKIDSKFVDAIFGKAQVLFKEGKFKESIVFLD